MATFWVDEKIGVDGKFTGYYENFQHLAPKYEGGLVYQTKNANGHTFKVSIGAVYTNSWFGKVFQRDFPHTTRYKIYPGISENKKCEIGTLINAV